MVSPSRGPARLPGIPPARDLPSALRAIEALREHAEARQGARGDPYERVLTVRDLTDAGLMRIGKLAPGATGVLTLQPDGRYRLSDPDEFAKGIMNSRLFRDLMKRLDDPTRFDLMPEEVQKLLKIDWASEAAKRGADIRRIESLEQSASKSLAILSEQVTAAVDGANAAVQQLIYAYAAPGMASAAIVNQIRVRLDEFGGANVTLEEVMLGYADNAGVLGQWTLKINAGGAVAGIGLAAEDDLAGNTTSKFIVAADSIAFVGPGETIGTGPGQVDPQNPGAGRIPFGVDTVNGVVYVNGQLRVNANGPRLVDLAAEAGISITGTAEAWRVDQTGANINTAIVLTANLAAGLTGNVTWSYSGGSYTGSVPGAGTTNSWDIYASSQLTDVVSYTATLVSGGVTYTDTITIPRLRDGVSAITALLTNETHTVPASAAGVPSSFTGASGNMRVYRGTTLLNTGVAYSVASNPDGVTISINASSGAYSATAAGTWAASSNTTAITLRATVGGVQYDKIFTLTKALTGAAGAEGQRGSLNTYGVLATLINYPARPSGLAKWASTTASSGGATAADNTARNLVWTALGNTGTPSNNDHLRIGDEVTLSNGAGTVSVTGYYGGGGVWLDPGVVIDGNLLVKGTVSADTFRAGTTGTLEGVEMTLGDGAGLYGYKAGASFRANSGAAIGLMGLNRQQGYGVAAANLPSAGAPVGALIAVASNNSTFTAFRTGAELGRYGEAGLFQGSSTGQLGTGTLRQLRVATNGRALENVATEGAAYIPDGYLPFTGSHIGIAPAGAEWQVGMIVVDDELVAATDISNTTFTYKPSSAANERGAVGVLARFEDMAGLTDLPYECWWQHCDGRAAVVNAVGEGQVLVCGQGGDIERGDLIVASDMRGIGMRQDDDIVRSRTVAKARMAVRFASPDQVLLVPCIYLCG
nr:DUF1983 domain-containing protein [Xenophilus sp. Marseille-Q4582]